MPTKLQQRKEEQELKLQRALSALARARWRERHRRQALASIVTPDRQVQIPDVPRRIASLTSFIHCFDYHQAWAYRALLLQLEQHGERLLTAADEDGDNPFRRGLICLAEQRRHWVRPLEAWRPHSKSAARQFSQLARHLLAQYEVPLFLDSVLLAYCPDYQEKWFRHVGQGGSLRTAPGMTAPLTKRMAHWALRAPSGCSAMEAVRWGQVLGLGGKPCLAEVVHRSRLTRELKRTEAEAWRQALIHWLVNHPELSPADALTIIEYADERRERDRTFSMQGRTPASVLRLSEEWDQRVAARRRAQEQDEDEDSSRYRYREFKPSGFAPGIWEAGRRMWTVEEIRCNRDLIREGRMMQHCVANYEDLVLHGISAIWSVQVEAGRRMQRAITVEVRPQNRTVIQARGKCNRLPNHDERKVLELWARENGLTVRV
jgi:hypothetical protein